MNKVYKVIMGFVAAVALSGCCGMYTNCNQPSNCTMGAKCGCGCDCAAHHGCGCKKVTY